MRSLGWLLVSLFLSRVVATIYDLPLHCAGREGRADEECQKPLQDVTTVVPGLFYVATLPCLDCPILKGSDEDNKQNTSLVYEENDLFFNISLSHGNRTVLLNGQTIFPNIPTSPHPVSIVAAQIAPGFSRANLDKLMDCYDNFGYYSRFWCIDDQQPLVALSYDYYSHWTESHPDTQTERWEVTFDAIGSAHGREFNNSEQYMLRITVQGKEIVDRRSASAVDTQTAGSLFENLQERKTLYEYSIFSVNLMMRSYKFPPKHTLSFLGKFRRFFGLDVMREDGHLVYLNDEWDSYGKKGSLRNVFGTIIYDWPWEIVGIVVGSAVGALLTIFAIWKLFFIIKQQRQLANWDGMDTVWENMRRERNDEEDDRLLDGEYRDEPDDESPPRYTDEVQVNKPLPSKPLPDKPLPAVPLIDA